MVVITRTKRSRKSSAKKRRPKPLPKKSKPGVDWEGVRRAIDELEHTVSGIYMQGEAVANSVALLRQQLPKTQPKHYDDDIPF